MKNLIHQFYDAISGKGEVPVSEGDAVMVLETMDKLWPRIKSKQLRFESQTPDFTARPVDKGSILVTGATGFLGQKLVEMACDRGYRVRSLARKLSNIGALSKYQTEIFYGDVADKTSLAEAVKDMDIVVHAAADTAGREDDSKVSTLLGTQNVIDVCKDSGIKKLIYISSCSVYGVADYRKDQMVDETASLERYPGKRGHYSNAKFKADQLILDALQKRDMPAVCLRPGTIFGPGGDIYTPMMGFSLGSRIFGIIGRGDFVLPLVYIDNLVEAIILAIEKKESEGQVFNVVDPEGPTKREYVELFLRNLYPSAKFFYLPYSLLYTAVWGQELLCRLLGRAPFLTRYRLTSSQKNIRYDSRKIQKNLDWNPPCLMKTAFEKVIQYEKNRLI